ncbi:MAG: SurA N-terminal domain-containing protein [Armatimonadetes bacterium]|nr:SurA N-terminal domain-containing protein [Armatimonadota bacterium]
MTSKNQILLMSALVLTVGLVGCGKGGSAGGSAIATVNGDKITSEELLDQLKSKPSVQVTLSGMPNDQAQMTLQMLANGAAANVNVAGQQGTLGFQAMRDLITRKVVFQMAKDQGVLPSEKDVEAEIALQTKRKSSYVKELQIGRNMSMRAIKENISFELARNNLITKGVTISDKDVDNYIEANPARFTDPAKVDLSWILVGTEAKKGEVDSELATGKNFKDVALAMSDDPNLKKNNGKLAAQPIPTAQLAGFSADLPKTIEATDVNKPTGWVQITIQGQTAFAKFYVHSKTAEKKNEPTAEDRILIKRELGVTRGAEGKEITQDIAKKIAEAKIEIQDPNMKGTWEDYVKQLKETLK